MRDQAQVRAAGQHVVRQAYGIEIDKNSVSVTKRSALGILAAQANWKSFTD